MASSRSFHAFSVGVVLSATVFFALPAQGASERGMVDQTDGYNEALLVGVSHGLPGIDLDVENAHKIASNDAYKFHTTYLNEEDGTTAKVAAQLAVLSEKTANTGTLFFYFSGHGGVGSLYMQDGTMKINIARQAMEQGRAALGPMKRLVMMFDSCYSGSLLDPMRVLPLGQVYDENIASVLFANQVVEEMMPARDAAPYWSKLFVFASSKADETSLAGDDGSVFTVALKKAYDEVIASNDTLDAWVKKTQTYTVGHHPVARFVPAALAQEKMVP